MSIDEAPVELTLRQRTILLLLLTEPGQRMSIDRLAEALWGDQPPKNPRNAVARFVADLRGALGHYGARIVTRDGGYLISVAPGELDHARVLELLDEVRATEVDAPNEALAAVAVALRLVGDGPNRWLDELLHDQVLVRQHDALRVEALDRFADLMLRCSRHVELVAVLERAVERHPHDEHLWQHLIEAFVRSGRSAEALRTCQRLRGELAEIGLEPSEDTLRLESRIAFGSASVATPAADQGVAEAGLAGRAEDLRAVESAVADHLVVSIIGSAGVGKSHLASAVCSDLALEGAIVYRVDVRAVPDAARLLPAMASIVGVPPALEMATPEELARHLAPVSCLLLLDGCDHLRSACVELVAALNGAPGVSVLVTARSPLRASGEYVHRLGPLATGEAVPTTPSPSARLFADRLGVDLDDPLLELDAIEAICTELTGHPGAICLAATLSATASEEAILHQILQREPSSNPMERVLDVAWDGLDAAEQSVLGRLSVFRGGCTPGAARAVCTAEGAPIDDELERLVAKGLMAHVSDRYVLEDIVREYAADRLTDRRETRVTASRLVDWLRTLTAPWGIPEIGVYAKVSDLLVSEQANLTAALTFLHDEGRVEELAWLAVRSAGMWVNHGRCAELVRWLGPLAEDGSVSAAARSAADACLLEADLTVGRYGTLVDWGDRCLELADGEPLDWVPMVAGFFAALSRMLPMAMSTDEYFDLAQRTADQSDSRRTNQAVVLLRRAQVSHHDRCHDGAVDLFRQGLALVEDEGRLLLALEMGETISLYNGGRKEEALASLNRWRSSVETDEWHYQVDIIRSIVVGGNGNPKEATRDLAKALRRHEPVSVWARADEFQMAFALLADMRGECTLAGELLSTPMSGSPFLTSMVAEHIAATRDLGPDGFQIVTDEIRSRHIAFADARASAHNLHELLDWWTTGQRRAPAEGAPPRR